MSVICRVLGHRRRRKSAWFDNVSWRAPCVRCEAPLTKDRFGRWHAMNKDELHDTSRMMRSRRLDPGRPSQPDS